jgi:predicted dehydrogenase
VVGCGLIGARRARVVARHEGTILDSVVDVRGDAAQALAVECGTRWFTDWKRTVADPGIDVVIVSTSNDHLMPVGVAALRAGKHVLIEKPMGRNLPEALHLQRAATESGGYLKIGFNHRYHPGIDRARGLVGQGRIGEVINARVRYGHGGRVGYEKEWRGDPALAGGGELTDQGVHVLDLLQCFLGTPREVVCITQTAFWPIGSLEDNAFALLRYSNGAAASLHTSWTQWKNLFSLELFGRDGYLTVEGLGGTYGTEVLTIGRRRPEGGPPEIEQSSYSGPDESWRLEWEDFVGTLVRGSPYQGTPEEGVATMKVLEALYQSARTGQPISVDGPHADGGNSTRCGPRLRH